MRRAAAIAVLAVALTAGSAGASSDNAQDRFVFFQLPSRNIACGYIPADGRIKASIRCDILSGLRPRPRGRCEGDWTGLSMPVTGRSFAQCAGDTVYMRNAPVLRYGRTWRRNGITCLSRTAGLRCTNRSRHGFELARERWRLF